ncbi:MAG: HAD family hydrolase [Candidatus Hodarchaeales archaeon]|jgi:phosphoglycolate phosphatase-like HAD superfamily hydrolase
MVIKDNFKGKLILFDFDGTLVDTKTYYFGLIADYLKSDKKETISVAGRILTSMLSFDEKNIKWKIIRASYRVSRVLGNNRLRAIRAVIYLVRNHNNYFEDAKPTKHAVEGLKLLKEKGITLGIISYSSKNKILSFLQNYVQDSTLFEISNIIVKKEFGKTKEEAINNFLKKFELTETKKLCAIVGDLGGDIIAGKNMGITSIGITTGYSSKQLLLEAKPDRIFNSVKEIANCVIIESG